MRYPTHLYDLQTILSPSVPLTHKVLDLSGYNFSASNNVFNYFTTTQIELGSGSCPISATIRVDGNRSSELKNTNAIFSYSSAIIKNVNSASLLISSIYILNNTIEFKDPSLNIPGSYISTTINGTVNGIMNVVAPLQYISAAITSIVSTTSNSWMFTVPSVPPEFSTSLDIQVQNMSSLFGFYTPFNTTSLISANIENIIGNNVYIKYSGSGAVNTPPPQPGLLSNSQLYMELFSFTSSFLILNELFITIPGGYATPDLSGSNGPALVSASDDSVYFAFISRYLNNISYSNSLYDIVLGHAYPNGTLDWIHRVSSLVTRLEEATPTLTIGASNELYLTYMTTGDTFGNLNGYNIYENTSNYGIVGCTGLSTVVGREDIVVAQIDTRFATPSIQPNVCWKVQNGYVDSMYKETKSVVCIDSVNQLVYVAYECNRNIACFTSIGAPNILLHCFTMKGNHLWVQAESNINCAGQNTSPSISADNSGNVYLAYEITAPVHGGANPGGRQIEVVRFQTILNNPSPSNTYNPSAIYTYGNWVYYGSSWYQVKVLSTSGVAPDTNTTIWSEPYSANLLYSGRVWVLSQSLNIFTIEGVPGDEASQPTIIAHANGNVFLGFLTTGRINDDYPKTTPPGGHDLVVLSFTRDLQIRWIQQGYMYNPDEIHYIDCDSPFMTMDSYGNLLLSLKTTIANIDYNEDPPVILAEYQNLAVFHYDQDGRTRWGYPRTETEEYPVYMYARSNAPGAVFGDASPECTFSKIGVSKAYKFIYVATVTDIVAPGQTPIGPTGTYCETPPGPTGPTGSTYSPSTIKTLCLTVLDEDVYYRDRNAFAYMTTTRGICQCGGRENCGCF